MLAPPGFYHITTQSESAKLVDTLIHPPQPLVNSLIWGVPKLPSEGKEKTSDLSQIRCEA